MLCLLAGVSLAAQAQPARSRVTKTPATAAKTAAKTATPPAADRAALMFPTSAEMPEDVVWRRDIYRTLDLTKDANAPLYYPVQPSGKNQNLFTYIFRLWMSGRIPVYEYRINGEESFNKEYQIKCDTGFLKKFYIYYETQNGKIVVPESDIPSARVKRYFIKESSFFDQKNATYKTRVTALCPVLFEGTDFMLDEDLTNMPEGETSPLFWVNYDDLAPYLSRMPLMASNLNNVTNMTVADYFTLNKYEGKIYKTNNMQGRLLKDYCKTDSAMNKEQERIEKQLTDFEEGIWGKVEQPDTTTATADSLAAEQPAKKTTARAAARSKKNSKSEDNTSRRSKAAAATAKRSSGNSAPRVSVRRQRR